MARFVTKDPPEFSTEMRMLEPTDPAHANLLNPMIEQLLNNDVFLKAVADAAKKHMQNDEIHVTEQDKELWDAKAGTAEATQSEPGLMSAGDKQKLDSVAENAEVNQDAFSKVKVGEVTIITNGKTATFTMESGDNITLTADNATKKVTIKSNRDGGNADMVDGYHAEHFANADHGHDGRYYTKTESDNQLKQKAASSHSHTKASITDFPTSMTPTAHTHSDYALKSLYGDSVVSVGRKSGSTVGNRSFVFGLGLEATGTYDAAFGTDNVSSADWCAFVFGWKSTASGNYSFAGGEEVTASGECSHAEGWKTVASGSYSHAEGCITTASGGNGSHTEGNDTKASNNSCHAEGQNTTASGYASHAEGYYPTASGDYGSHAEGNYTEASGEESHAEGYHTVASANASHAEGFYTIASNFASHAGGRFNANMINGGSFDSKTGHAFVIGNGTAINIRSNALSLLYSGILKTAGTITASTAADYAEFFEWMDMNPDAEDRVGHFVALDGDKVRIADSTDTYILGIVSGRPFVLGNGDCDTWAGMYLHDEFNREIMEPAPKIEMVEITEEVEREVEEVDKETGEIKTTIVKETIIIGHEEREVFDEDGNLVYEGTRPKLNPEYDYTQKYISRFDRPEWAAIGMLGVLAVYDDGSCQVNGYCRVADGGIATAADGEYMLAEGKILRGYRVIERVTEDIVKVIFR